MNRGYLSQQPQQLQQMHQGYPPSIYHQTQQSQQPLQQQPQQQQQQQQQPHSMLNGQNPNHQINGNASTDAQSQAASGGPGGQEMNLASVLHYLQSEWRRWERDRNEWEIERAEMRARIALLEGQRRSAENLKVDLLRRVKMLEFALRQERTKAVSGPSGKAPAVPPSRLAALQDEDKASVKDDKEGSVSEGSEEGSSERPRVNGIGTLNRPINITGRAMPDTSVWKSIGSVPPRDPKSRARSREYLKQCLQEVTYLTSPGALNPLPSRPPISVPESGSPGRSNNDLNNGPVADRPTKILPDEPIKSPFAPKIEVKEEPSEPAQPPVPESSGQSEEIPAKQEHLDVKKELVDTQLSIPTQLPDMDKSAQPPSSPAVLTMSLPDTESNGTSDAESDGKPHQDEDSTSGGAQLLTAIYRPESKAAWRAELRAANEKAEKIRNAQDKPVEPSDEEQLTSLSLPAEEEDTKSETSDTGERLWVTRKTLRSHLDIVRSVSFASGPGILLASGGDDNTVKVWSIDPASVMLRNKLGKAAKNRSKDVEPIATFRGHTAAVTTVLVSSSLETIFSASMDKTIRLWRFPSATADPYGPYDPNTALQILEGHTDIVWDLVLLPAVNGAGKEDRLMSASADGTVKLWTLENGKWALSKSFSFDDGALPTCLAPHTKDYNRVLIGLTDGRILLWDVWRGAGAEVVAFGEKSEDAQPNAVISHPDMSTVVSAHEDGHLRFFEAKHGPSPTHTVLAHPGAVTSLALSPLTGLTVLSASVDCTVKMWDLAKKTASQELGGHRKRSDEGVCAVASHPELPIIASAGADGVIRIWSDA